MNSTTPGCCERSSAAATSIAQSMVDAIFDDVGTFAGGRLQDDATAMVVAIELTADSQLRIPRCFEL